MTLSVGPLCLTSPMESDTPDTPVEPASVIRVLDRQEGACDEASSRGATEPRRRRGVAPTARREKLDRRRPARAGSGAPVVFLAAVCLAGGDVQPQTPADLGVWREAQKTSNLASRGVIGLQRWSWRGKQCPSARRGGYDAGGHSGAATFCWRAAPPAWSARGR